jgi:hypothetical protein
MTTSLVFRLLPGAVIARTQKGPPGQHESMLLSRQPRACQASALCISLWMISVNKLVNHYTAVDGHGCGKVDNRCGIRSRAFCRP